nr:NAD-dependent epimerase/dehydratase family protein [Asticcacaulis sp.]
MVTGAVGFIGHHTCQALLDLLTPHPGFRFQNLDIADRDGMTELVRAHPEITGVIHLAAQAGVRHSLIDPYTYIQTNLMGQVVMLEAARLLPGLQHFVYASSSSVYGADAVRRSHSGRKAHPGVQPWRHGPRLHLCR